MFNAEMFFYFFSCAKIYCLQFLIAMDGKHFNEVQKAFIDVMEELETNSTHSCDPSQLIVKVFDVIDYNHIGLLTQQVLREKSDRISSKWNSK